MLEIRVKAITWNVAETDPSTKDELNRLVGETEDIDVLIIGLQEIKTGVVVTALSFVEYDEWARSFMVLLSTKNFFMAESQRMQGISICVFVKKHHVPFLRSVKIGLERTGFEGNWGNKGAVAVSMRLYGISCCMLNTHLTAHLQYEQERVRDFKQVVNGITFNNTTAVLNHDLVIWLGDTNFRINDIPRDEVVHLCEKKSFTKLLEHDQLLCWRQRDDIFKGFVEAPITFPPTYKFDVGTDIYDTSSKQRKPAWTDRVLYRLHPDFNTLSRAGTSGLISNGKADIIQHVDGSYRCTGSFYQSDHRPVESQYILKVNDEYKPLVHLSVTNGWETEVRGSFHMQLHEGFKVTEKEDWIGLYETPITDFRTYKHWVWANNDAPLEADSTSDVQKYNVTFPAEVHDEGEYVLAYYCEKLSCILAISKPFYVKETKSSSSSSSSSSDSDTDSKTKASLQKSANKSDATPQQRTVKLE